MEDMSSPPHQLEHLNLSVDVILASQRSSNIQQPAVSLSMKLREEQGGSKTKRFTIDLKTFETLRFCVAKALSSTDQYRAK